MSKYNLEDLLNEYIGGGRIGTLKISFKDLQDKMDELEKSDRVIVRTLSGPSGDGKVNREFEVVDRDSAVAGGGKQERGFTVYDYKFGFDPGSEEHFMEEYPFSVGGNDLKLAMELIDGVEAGIREEEIEDYEKELKKAEPMELPKKFRDSERDQIEKDARKFRGDIQEEKGIGQLYVQPAVQKEIRFHLDAYEKGDIEVDDMIQAIEDIIFGRIPAPGMREDLFKRDGGSEDNVDNIDKVSSPSAKGKGYSSAVAAQSKESGDEMDQITQTTKPMFENGHLEDYKDELPTEGMYIDHDDFMDEIYVARAKEIAPILKGIDMDIIVDFVKTHIEDIRGASDEEIKDEFEEFRSVNYDYIDEDLKEHFNRFLK